MDRPKTPAAVNLRNPYLAAFLAWLVPGLGHFYQGRRGKGILYLGCILGLFLVGLFLGEGKIVFWRWINPLRDSENFRLPFLGQFWVGLFGAMGVIQASLVHYDHDVILGGIMAEPDPHVMNHLYSLGKLVDVGTVYTIIAGLLNVLAIFDAMEGPAMTVETTGEAAKVVESKLVIVEPA